VQAKAEGVAEMTDHFGCPPHAVEGRGSGNSRSCHHPKTVRTEIGDVAVKAPFAFDEWLLALVSSLTDSVPAVRDSEAREG
jgi:hypothetical protein